ncbi:MAG: hypothetical protein ACI9NQ_001485 [Paracoccaceae bacterium]|jgi:hypothetical protein
MAPPPPKKLPIQKRFRSVPFPRPFVKAAIVSSIFLLSVVCFVTTIVAFALLQTQTSAYLIVGTMLITIFIWTVSLFARRAARCPLCQGSPYFNSGARKHEKATKIPLINHGMTNVIRTIVNQTFRCMYCGEPYDFLKPVRNPISGTKKGKKGPKAEALS